MSPSPPACGRNCTGASAKKGSGWAGAAAFLEQVKLLQRAGLCQPVFGSREFRFHTLVEPLLQLGLRRLRHVVKTESGKSFHVGPCNFGFDVDVDAAFG